MKSDDPSDQRITDQDTFYHRWSERKQASSLPIAEVPEPVEEPQLTDADMPPLESLDEGSDYSGFLSPKVSEQLRQLALRKLFHSAAFNVCDGLDDYAEDFTSFEKLGDLMTADLRHRLEQEARKRQQSEDEADDAELATAESDQSPDPQLADHTEQPENDMQDGCETLQSENHHE
ncbi:MAG: DUF3306 domain-containing protein [Candidatus Thiodiazotropha sp. (ex Lucinoma borealis)]|nr:DUF3306 domain-containing protein [Candidatus Thiodiazotropha sp. (ex Lucinoma borealis)]